MPDTQTTRHENLLKLFERFAPDTNIYSLLSAALPPLAFIQRGQEGYWISVHVDRDEAYAYFKDGGRPYVPKLLADLDSGQTQTWEEAWGRRGPPRYTPPAPSDQVEMTRRENLLKLLERFIPDNANDLLSLDGNLPAWASVQRGPRGDWISLHEDPAKALTYFAQDDSDYVPTLLINLVSGQATTVEQQVSYQLSAEPSSLAL
jgi:hypothetical protein